jgi:hypothetical protein
MSRAAVPRDFDRVSYRHSELVGPALGREIVGFQPCDWQPYPKHLGRRLSRPAASSPASSRFREIAWAAASLHLFVTDCPLVACYPTIWAAKMPARLGYLYFRLEGDGRVEVIGLGSAQPRWCLLFSHARTRVDPSMNQWPWASHTHLSMELGPAHYIDKFHWNLRTMLFAPLSMHGARCRRVSQPPVISGTFTRKRCR